MNGAINIRTENDTASPIFKLWEIVGKLENSPSMQTLNYAPHFTFAIYDDVEPDEMKLAAEKAANNLPKIDITFSKISIFDAERLVLWLEADDESELFSIHQKIHKVIPPQKCHEYYQPLIWQPHCTLGMKFTPNMRKEALEFAIKPIEPFTVTFDIIDWLTFSPVNILGEIPLR